MAAPAANFPEFGITRKFGLEYEMGFPAELGDVNNICARLRQASGQDVQCPSTQYGRHVHVVTPYWKIVPDPSVRVGGGTASWELVSPILTGQDGLDKMTAMLRAAEGLGAKVNKTGGHHVHIDALDLNVDQIKKVCAAYIVYEKAFDLLTSRSRQGDENQWCKSNQGRLIAAGGGSLEAGLRRLMQATTKEAVVAIVNPQMGNGARYHKLNLTNLIGGNGHGTIEFRMHQATDEWLKSRNWVEFIQRFAQSALTKDPLSPADVPVHESPAKLWLHMMHKMVNRAHLTAFFWKRICELDSRDRMHGMPRIVRSTTTEREQVRANGYNALSDAAAAPRPQSARPAAGSAPIALD